MLFRDRRDAGRRLAARLREYAGRPDVLILALPRGGVPVGYEVARALGAPLDIFVVRKLGVPGHEELAMGALASGGTRVLNRETLELFRIPREEVERVAAMERRELERRERSYRGDRPPQPVEGKTVILVDDGLATGASMEAAVRALRQRNPARIVVAVPTAPAETCEALRASADEVVCVSTPEPFYAVGRWYEDFTQTGDEEVRRLLDEAASGVRIPAGGVEVAGDLIVPPGAHGIVVFAHGSGSSRHSPRNRYVAEVLRAAGMGTLLMDLLTLEEEREDQWTGRFRFDVELLGSRLIAATDWLAGRSDTRELRVGYFGASTGAAAALIAAAERPEAVAAIVSRGGRPDLAGPALGRVRAPTLLIVGSLDHPVIELNRRALAQITAPAELMIVPGASHLFEEPGTLEEVGRLAAEWFTRHLTAAPAHP